VSPKDYPTSSNASLPRLYRMPGGPQVGEKLWDAGGQEWTETSSRRVKVAPLPLSHPLVRPSSAAICHAFREGSNPLQSSEIGPDWRILPSYWELDGFVANSYSMLPRPTAPDHTSLSELSDSGTDKFHPLPPLGWFSSQHPLHRRHSSMARSEKFAKPPLAASFTRALSHRSRQLAAVSSTHGPFLASVRPPERL